MSIVLESERVNVAMLSDDGVLGVIGLTNDELAGSLRNTSRLGTPLRVTPLLLWAP